MESEYDYTVEVSPPETLSVLQQATCSFYVAKSLEGISDTAYINRKDVFFISFIAAIEGLPKEATSPSPAAQLESVLSSKRVPVPGDGNSLFTSVSLALLQHLQSKDERLSALRLPMEQMHDMTVWLRKALTILSTILKGFVTTNITVVAYQYQTSGQFTGDLGEMFFICL